MNCYNGEDYLQEAIDSVYSQTYQNWEIIFWDNCSTDKSAEIAKSYDNKVKYYKSNELISLGLGRREAVNVAKGEYVAFLDTDDLWVHDKLEQEVRTFQKNSTLSVIYSNCQPIDERGDYLGHPTVNKFYSGKIFNLLLEGKVTPPLPTIIVNANAIRNVGSFRDFKSAEDKDILLKLAFEYEFGYIEKVLAYYRMHPKQMSKDYSISLNESITISNYWKNRCKKDTKIKKYVNLAISNAYYKAAIYSVASNVTKREMIKNTFNSLSYSIRLKNLFLLTIVLLPKKAIFRVFLLTRKIFGRGATLFYMED